MLRKSFLLILTLLIVATAVSCKEEAYAKYTLYYEYVTGEQYFTFFYPRDWEVVEDEVIKNDGTSDGRPDFGVRILMDGEDNRIDILEGISPNMYWDEKYAQSDFTLDDIRKGTIYSNDHKDRIYRVIRLDRKDEDYAYRYIIIQADRSFYKKNRKGIEKVLESIEY